MKILYCGRLSARQTNHQWVSGGRILAFNRNIWPTTKEMEQCFEFFANATKIKLVSKISC